MTTSDVSLRSGSRLAAHSVAIAEPFDLLDAYAPGGFAWLDGETGFVTSGVAAVVEVSAAHAFLATITHWSDDAVPVGAGPRAVGALPFRGAGHLAVPARIVGRDADGRMWRTVIETVDAPSTNRSSAHPAPAEFRVTSNTTPERWHTMVEQTLADIDAGLLEKVVLARAVHVDADRPFDIAGIVAYLRQSQPGCTVYADGGFVGASPELLVRKVGADVTARPLAGTGTDTAALVRSAKDAHEHRLVVDAVVRRAARPVHRRARRRHRATRARRREPSGHQDHRSHRRREHDDHRSGRAPPPHSRGCRCAARAGARHHRGREVAPRGRYAGPCGWIDRNGDGEFVVALRGGEIDGAHAVIYAGAGIVAGSDPAAEWAETQQKLTPMLQALVRP